MMIQDFDGLETGQKDGQYCVQLTVRNEEAGSERKPSKSSTRRCHRQMTYSAAIGVVTISDPIGTVRDGNRNMSLLQGMLQSL